VDEWATIREVDQRFAEMGRRIDGIDGRLTNLAKDAVMADVWARENEHFKERHEEILKAVEAVQTSITRKSEWTWSRALAIAGITATVAVGWVTVVLTTRGIK